MSKIIIDVNIFIIDTAVGHDLTKIDLPVMRYIVCSYNYILCRKNIKRKLLIPQTLYAL